MEVFARFFLSLPGADYVVDLESRLYNYKPALLEIVFFLLFGKRNILLVV